MHDCRKTQKELRSLLFDDSNIESENRLAMELRVCPACRAERAALENVLEKYRVFDALDRPSEAYWQNYETALRAKIFASDAPAPKQIVSTSPVAFWRRLFAVSIPVPAPVAAAFVALLATVAFFAARSPEVKTRVVEIPAPPVQMPNQPATIEKIVIREKPVERVTTRKIYLPSRETRFKNNSSNPVLARQNEKSEKAAKAPALNLAEFQPPPKIEFKVIKDGLQDEK